MRREQIVCDVTRLTLDVAEWNRLNPTQDRLYWSRTSGSMWNCDDRRHAACSSYFPVSLTARALPRLVPPCRPLVMAGGFFSERSLGCTLLLFAGGFLKNPERAFGNIGPAAGGFHLGGIIRGPVD
jgi:hypothetical protein